MIPFPIAIGNIIQLSYHTINSRVKTRYRANHSRGIVKTSGDFGTILFVPHKITQPPTTAIQAHTDS